MSQSTAQLRLVFMGTPSFAVPSLAALLQAGYDIAAVITAPDQPQGRGKKIKPSAVKQFALENHLPVLQPINLKDPNFIADLQAYQADLYVVVAFRMLPHAVWSIPALGTINLHASLLPQYRGAAPINWAIINGEAETGVTTFFIEETIDTGQILLQEKEAIAPNDTAGSLSERLQNKGAALLLKTVQAIATGKVIAQNQPDWPVDQLKKAPKIYKADGEINWQQTTENILNFIRGLSPYPGAWTTLQGNYSKIWAAASAAAFDHLTPGAIASDHKHYLVVGTQDGAVAIEQLQIAGKQVMDIQAFLRGHASLI